MLSTKQDFRSIIVAMPTYRGHSFSASTRQRLNKIDNDISLEDRNVTVKSSVALLISVVLSAALLCGQDTKLQVEHPYSTHVAHLLSECAT